MRLFLTTASVVFACSVCSVARGADGTPTVSDRADTNGSPDEIRQQGVSSRYFGTYCGVASLFCIARSFGVEAEFRDLLLPEYITTRQGSTTTDLELAAKSIGLQTSVITGATPEDLALIGTPAILHVSWEGDPATYNHWVAYMGERESHPFIVDVPKSGETYDPEELLARWDGLAICVSNSPVQSGVFYGRRLVWVGNLVLLLLAIRWASRRISLRAGSYWPTGAHRGLYQGIAIVLIAGSASLVYHALFSRGFLQNSQAVQLVAEAYAPTFLQKLQEPELRSLIESDSSVVLVDARYASDYRRGHLPGAINVPVNSSLGERRRLLDGIARDARIVVYCQSAGCRFDDRIASFLVADGYRNVLLFPGGWNEWDSHRGTDS